MTRKVLLIEPDYKNKYPPMGLMKIATYYRRLGDDVRFFKGDLKKLAVQLLAEDFYHEIGNPELGKHFEAIQNYIRLGKSAFLESIPNFREDGYQEIIAYYRKRYQKELFPRFDVVGVTTLFTFYWKKTIETINFAKKYCKPHGKMLVGGVAATILPERIFEETGIKPHEGLLDKPGDLDEGNECIIDEMPLDYSILDEIDYVYPARDAYFGYMTRGCIRKCPFCAVTRLEPKYKDYISIKKQIQYTDKRFGRQRDLLLMDNNVLASSQYDRIIEEIKECGFERGASYVPDDEYEVALRNVKEGYNLRGSLRKLLRLYDKIAEKLTDTAAGELYIKREEFGLLYEITASKEAALAFDKYFHPLYERHTSRVKRLRYIDFNQGIDARLVTDEKMKKLSEVNIRPLRIAFDHYEQKDIYVNAVRTAAKYGIKYLSNYLLYNFLDRPEELYYRMRINVELCEELDVRIHSFPMKYHPIDDPKYFSNRDYIGTHWNRKFIRAVQAVLNSTKGKIGRGVSFFEEAFGKDIEGFFDILWMPEAFIIHRMKYKDNLTCAWRESFKSLDEYQKGEAQNIIMANIFSDEVIERCEDKQIRKLLEYYKSEHGIAGEDN